jgi:hypothetical protein
MAGPETRTGRMQGNACRHGLRAGGGSGVGATGMITRMNTVFAQILGLGQGVSSFGVTLALLLTFIVGIGGPAVVLIGLASARARAERREDAARRAAYLSEHSS